MDWKIAPQNIPNLEDIRVVYCLVTQRLIYANMTKMNMFNLANL